jgi:D-glycero-D-manno-heptose 1,7-bisphosphate phosphatase
MDPVNPVHTQIIRPVPEGTPVRRAVFLDSDGVIVEDIGYLHRLEDIRYIEGSLAAIAKLNRLGIPVVVVTNQSGVGRGYYGWREYEQVQANIERRLAEQGGWLDASLACACNPDALGALAVTGHPFQKPNPGMLHAAASNLALDLAASWLIGDKLLDVEAAFRAGLRGALHVRSGYGAAVRGSVERWAAENARGPFEVRYAETLADAVSAYTASLSSSAG